jgi:DNA-binding FadR family transcriptional regulator
VAQRARATEPEQSMVRSGAGGWRDLTIEADDRKLGERIAEQIQRDIVGRGWPVGVVLGSEAELLERYGVSRAVFREAVRIVEYLGVARMRRGPNGGLVVTEPDPSAVIVATVLYFAYAQIPLGELLAARRPIEQAAAELAALRATEADIARLEARIDDELRNDRTDHWVIHDLIASISGNPAIELFVEILSRITAQFQDTGRRTAQQRRDERRESAAAHTAVLTAIVVRNQGAAGRRMGRHLGAIEAYLASREAQTLGVVVDESAQAKLSGVVSRKIAMDVFDRGWPVGELLGSEHELLERYQVSRAVLREAVRLLEFHGIVATRRGPGGGVFVAAPRADAIADSMTAYLAFRKIRPSQLVEVRNVLELASIELAATALDESGVALLDEAVRGERAASADMLVVGLQYNLHLRIAELTGNRALWLFLLVLMRLTAHLSPPAPADPALLQQMTAAVQKAHSAIVEAIVAGNPELARRRMQRHLDVQVPMLVEARLEGSTRSSGAQLPSGLRRLT